ncbi:MAG: nucleotidyltransferase domain-containing protein [Acidobacteriota bacterium]
MERIEPNDVAERLLPVLEESEGLLAAYLFGSRARGAATRESDLDVGILFDRRAGLEQLIHLQQELEDAAGVSVDVVDLRAASPFLALDVVRGIRFFCKDEIACDELELYVLRRAGDLEPLERERRAGLLGLEM